MNAIKDNWRTSSVGISTIGLALIHVGFLIAHGALTEESCIFAFGQVLLGYGMIQAGDAKKSQKDAEDLKQQVAQNAQDVSDLKGNTPQPIVRPQP